MGNVGTTEEALALKAKGEVSVVVVYAPWCKFCQAMEDEFDKVAGVAGVPTYKFRGDEQRDFVGSELNTQSFPTINLITASGEVVKYESEARSASDIAAF